MSMPSPAQAAISLRNSYRARHRRLHDHPAHGWSRRFRGALQEAALPSGRQLRFHFSGRHLSVRGGDTRRRSDREPCRRDRNGASAARQAVVQLRRLRIVIGDRIQLRQVLLNLIANATDSMAGEDEPRILSVKSGVQDSGIMVAVADSGKGIASQDVGRIFSCVYRKPYPC